MKSAVFGGPEEIRTLDFLHAKQALSQLSYRPILIMQRKILYHVITVISTVIFRFRAVHCRITIDVLQKDNKKVANRKNLLYS